MNRKFFWLGLLVMVLLVWGAAGASIASAQAPTPTPAPVPTVQPQPSGSGLPIPGLNELDKVYAIVRMVSDLVQGKVTPNPDQLFTQSKQSATDLISQQGAG